MRKQLRSQKGSVAKSYETDGFCHILGRELLCKATVTKGSRILADLLVHEQVCCRRIVHNMVLGVRCRVLELMFTRLVKGLRANAG